MSEETEENRDVARSLMTPATRPPSHAMIPSSEFNRRFYFGFPVDSLKLFNRYVTKGNSRPSEPIGALPVGSKQPAWNIVINGTYMGRSSGGVRAPSGPVIRDGVFDTNPEAKAEFRGALATYSDGSVEIGRTNGLSWDALTTRFGGGGLELVDLLGGMALIVENFAATDVRSDLVARQKFPADIGDQQFRPTWHTVLGIRDSQLYVLIARKHPAKGFKSGFTIQQDLVSMGFQSALKLDGGSGFHFRYYQSNGMPAWEKDNTTGFGIMLRTATQKPSEPDDDPPPAP